MKDTFYGLTERPGTSTPSIEDALNKALQGTGRTVQDLSWIQIVEARGNIDKDRVNRWQATIKLGFTVT